MIEWDDIKEQVGKWTSFKELFEAGGAQAQMLAACVTGNAEYVEQLLSGDAKLANVDAGGFRAIWLAAHFGHRRVSELLIGAGVDIHGPCGRHPHDGPLHVAARRGHVDVVALLLDRGASAVSSGRTPLHCAAENNHAGVLRLLAEAGADLEARGNFDLTPLQCAILAGNLDAVVVLVNAGADVNANPSQEPDTGWIARSEAEWPLLAATSSRPLFIAVSVRLPSIVELLLDHGAEINALSYGWSALHAAAAHADKGMVELLLRRGADPYIRSDVKSPLGEEYNHRTPMELLAGFRRSSELLRNATR